MVFQVGTGESTCSVDFAASARKPAGFPHQIPTNIFRLVAGFWLVHGGCGGEKNKQYDTMFKR